MGLRSFSLAALALLGLPGSSTELYFQPAENTTLERSVEVFASIDLDDAEITAMGQTMGPEAMGRDFSDASAEMTLDFTQVDLYHSSERGHALSLLRTFGQGRFNGDPLPDEGPRSVQFDWDGATKRHTASLPEGSDQDAEDEQIQRILTVMRGEVDAQFLLPSEAVEPGAAWEVELGLQELLDLILPGLDVEQSMALAKVMMEEEMAKADEDQADEIAICRQLMNDLTVQMQGALKPIVAQVSLASIETIEGRQVARLPFTFEVAFDLDPAATILAALEQSEEAPELKNFRFEIHLSAEMEGELLWDVEGKFSRELSLNGDYSIDASGGALVVMEEMGEMPFEGLVAFSGAIESTHRSTTPAAAEEAAAKAQ
jgi:hypothetical protein